MQTFYAILSKICLLLSFWTAWNTNAYGPSEFGMFAILFLMTAILFELAASRHATRAWAKAARTKLQVVRTAEDDKWTMN